MSAPQQVKMPVALTERQQIILSLIAEGLTTKEIAARLNISDKTVEFHRASLRRALGVNSSVLLVRTAIRLGLITV
jgi:DNA-binding NarL/FixJ family response regulator